MGRNVRRYRLHPLSHDPQRLRSPSAINNALKRLYERALGESVIPEFLKNIPSKVYGHRYGRFIDSKIARNICELVRALRRAGRISQAEYVFHIAWIIAEVVISRLVEGAFQNELSPIEQQMARIRAEHCIAANEDFVVADAPDEYRQLDDAYGRVIENFEIQALREFGFAEIAELRESNSAEYDRLRERGRRHISHREEYIPALRDVVARYQEDAERAANAEAFYAAATLLGAAAEGLLLLRCLRSKRKAQTAAQQLPRRLRSGAGGDPRKWTFEILIEVCARAGWLPTIESTVAAFDSRSMAHFLRSLRNLVHPGRQVSDRPWLDLDRTDYNDAHAVYTLLFNALSERRQRGR